MTFFVRPSSAERKVFVSLCGSVANKNINRRQVKGTTVAAAKGHSPGSALKDDNQPAACLWSRKFLVSGGTEVNCSRVRCSPAEPSDGSCGKTLA